MQIILTSGARHRLKDILNQERKKNPNIVFRIWETTRGRYNEAKICLCLTLDEAEADDEYAACCNLPFVASRDFLDLRGEPHIFCILTNKAGMPEVQELGR